MAWRRVILLTLAALVINLPFVHSSYQTHRVTTDGRRVTATVTSGNQLASGYFVAFRYPSDIDPDQRLWTAQVDRTTYDDSRVTRTIGVRVRPGHPAAYRVDGQIVSQAPLILTLAGDVLLLLLGLAMFRFGGRWRRPRLEARAIGDLEPCPPGSRLDKQPDGTHVIAGQVSTIGVDQVVLDLGDREVVVHLGGRPNPVQHGQPARVTARLVG
ncbi:MAG: hypothetical protein ACR2K3_08905 [Nocardioides sp.]